MYGKMKDHLSKTLAEIKEAGLYKEERLIESAQQAAISVKGKEVLNFCANNYLGLSNHPRLIAAAQQIMERRGYGMSSVRFICGTQDIHKELEAAISDYFKTEDTILYAACFDANGGVFEPLFTEEDAIISDSLNHASIIDGVRLCKAKRYRYANADMADLERCLQEAQAQRFRIVVTDGVFSMDGNVAPMDRICDLAEKYDALVMVDESHSAGVVGPTGHGVSEQYGTYGRVDIYTGTLGKAFGGALGGFTTGRKEIIDLLLVLEIAHLLSAVELHDQIGQRGENALAGKAALAHRNALVHTRYHGKRNIIPPVNKKAVQIEGMFADAARTDFPTGFFILGKRRVINTSRAERIRFQHFPSPRNYRYGRPQPTAQRNGRLQQCYYIQADFFALRFLVARMNSASSSAANTIPIGYATAVL